MPVMRVNLLRDPTELRNSYRGPSRCATSPKGPIELSKMSPVTILVVDDSEAWRRFIAFILRLDPALEIVCEAGDALNAVETAAQHRPDVVLMDIGLPGISGIEAGREIVRRVPECKVIFVTQQSEPDVVQHTLLIGALGYVLKLDAGSELVSAIRSASQGKRYLSSSLPPSAGTLQ